MPVLRPYEDQVSLSGIQTATATADDFGGASGKALMQAGSDIEQASANVNEVDDVKSRLRAANLVTQADSDWRQQMLQRQQDPDFAAKYGEDGSGFSDSFKNDFEAYATQQIGDADPRDRKYVEQGMYNLGGGLMNSAMEFEAQTGAQFATQTIQNSIDAGRNNAMMSPDQTASIMQNTNLVISQAPHLNEAQRLKLSTDMQQQVSTGAVMGLLQKQGPAAAQQVLDGTMTIPVANQDGSIAQKNIADVMDGNMFQSIQGAAGTVIKQADTAAKQVQTDLKDDFMTKAKLAETPNQFIQLASDIEGSKDSMGKKNYDDLQVEMHERMKKINEDADSQTRGNLFATGDAYLNPSDTQSMKDYNSYYKNTVQPTLAALSPEARNTRLTQLVDTTKVIPDDLKGDVKIAARSNDPTTITNTADFVDRLRNSNPNLLQDFDQKDLARIDMVNQRITSGLTPSEAIAQTDSLLNPVNKAVTDARTTDLKGMAKGHLGFGKNDYETMALDNFQSNAFVRALPGKEGEVDQTSPIAKSTMIQMGSEYKAAYESQYKVTGDTTAAQKYANTVISGAYGVTNINGDNQVMKYPPEKYFAINGDKSNDWMRQQLQDTINKVSANTLQAPGTDFSKRVSVVPDAFTARSASTGTPQYKLMYQQDDGTLTDLLGSNKYFTFDAAKHRQDLISAQRADAAAAHQARENPYIGAGMIAP